GDNGSVRSKTVSERRETLRGRSRAQAPSEAVTLPHAQIVDGPDVHAAKLEHQIHLRGPPADASHGREPDDDLVVREPRRSVEDDGAVEDLRGQVAKRCELVGGQTGGTERSSGYVRQRPRRERSADRGTDARVDGAGGSAGELLEHDRTD